MPDRLMAILFRAALLGRSALPVLGTRPDEPLVPRLGMLDIPAGVAMRTLSGIRSPGQWVQAWEVESKNLLTRLRGSELPADLQASGLRRAASLLRVAEYMATDDVQRRDLWSRLVELHVEARRLDSATWLRLEAPYGGGGACPIDLCLPRTSGSPAPLILTLGGVDAAKEEFVDLSRLYASLGWASAAVDLPGQGEARRCRGLTWQTDPFGALSSVLDALEEVPSVAGQRVIVVGGSLGGFFAAHLALRDDRVAAVATLCSPAEPATVFGGAPRPIPQTMMFNLGINDPAAAMQEFEGWRLPERPFTKPHFALTSGDDSTAPLATQLKLVEAIGSPSLTNIHFSRGDHMCFRYQTEWELELRNWLSCVASPQDDYSE